MGAHLEVKHYTACTRRLCWPLMFVCVCVVDWRHRFWNLGERWSMFLLTSIVTPHTLLGVNPPNKHLEESSWRSLNSSLDLWASFWLLFHICWVLSFFLASLGSTNCFIFFLIFYHNESQNFFMETACINLSSIRFCLNFWQCKTSALNCNGKS